MISLQYTIMCMKCTKTDALFSGTKANAEKEARSMGYKKRKGEWHCKDCLEECDG